MTKDSPSIPPQQLPLSIQDEMRTSYLDYAMSVIVSRALPDVRDGLKPVHRRILYTMGEMGLSATSSYRKCAAIVGEVCDQRAVELHDLGFEVNDVLEVRIARAEVVHGKRDTLAADLAQDAMAVGEVTQRDRLGHL